VETLSSENSGLRECVSGKEKKYFDTILKVEGLKLQVNEL